MPDRTLKQNERRGQRRFSPGTLAGLLLILTAVYLFDRALWRLPDLDPQAPRQAEIRFDTVKLDPRGFGALRLRGAWRVDVDDRRFGGISALAWDDGRLLALSDAGTLIRFAPPSRGTGWPAEVRELPGGPGHARFKRHRDVEAISADPGGRGWWVAFESRDALWLFDPAFTRGLDRIDLAPLHLPYNKGIEALAADGTDVLAVAENRPLLWRFSNRRPERARVAGLRGRVADALRLPDGRLLLIEGRLGPGGFAYALAEMERAPGGYRIGRRHPLGLGPLDNAEAIAAEPLAGGGVRLWVMTDDNFQRPLRSLLVALDWPAPKRRAGGV